MCIIAVCVYAACVYEYCLIILLDIHIYICMFVWYLSVRRMCVDSVFVCVSSPGNSSYDGTVLFCGSARPCWLRVCCVHGSRQEAVMMADFFLYVLALWLYYHVGRLCYVFRGIMLTGWIVDGEGICHSFSGAACSLLAILTSCLWHSSLKLSVYNFLAAPLSGWMLYLRTVDRFQIIGQLAYIELNV